MKKDHAQYLIDKRNDQNATEILNDYVLIIANKLRHVLEGFRRDCYYYYV
jgi:hypothetical protein